MKKLFTMCLVAALSTPVWAQAAEPVKEAPRTKRVCVDIQGKDGKPIKNKDGSVKQDCRTMKIHKKHEGTKIPEKK